MERIVYRGVLIEPDIDDPSDVNTAHRRKATVNGILIQGSIWVVKAGIDRELGPASTTDADREGAPPGER